MATIKCAIPTIKVDNMELAEAFYCGQLGFEKKFQNKPTENADPSYIGIIRDGIWLHLSSFSGDGVSGTVVSIAVTDVDAFHEEFKSNGVKIGMEPVTQTWGTREMGLDDPSGNNLRFGTWV